MHLLWKRALPWSYPGDQKALLHDQAYIPHRQIAWEAKIVIVRWMYNEERRLFNSMCRLPTAPGVERISARALLFRVNRRHIHSAPQSPSCPCLCWPADLLFMKAFWFSTSKDSTRAFILLHAGICQCGSFCFQPRRHSACMEIACMYALTRCV